ncbi:hypothetical protein [Natrialbaceae archaeon AArc-T1-2]|uniref:hypothetical protein n=1 Tax=Natrialbaceae archaeon AArc-T1-2 TaxID=3053904 RepID=UPI00255B144B|nr:hypothetical protein [Natrialbaceae archaeon AArc-T1-2]WIV68520.1 hypothetical protein QQ977_07305 [Natrialbaceae archaeon AArc-T1-2]
MTTDSALEIVDWARLAERLCFLFPPVVGVGVVGVLRDVDPSVPGFARGLVLVGTFGYTLLTLAMAVTLCFDARRVRESGVWQPTPWLYTIGAVLWAPAAGVVYLYRRHRHFGTPPGWSGWWLVVAGSLLVTLTGGAIASVAFVLELPGVVTSAIGVAGAIAVGLFPVAIHQDAAYVCTQGSLWRPNPAGYLGVAFLSLFVPPLQPLLAAYYLLRRRRAIGTP